VAEGQYPACPSGSGMRPRSSIDLAGWRASPALRQGCGRAPRPNVRGAPLRSPAFPPPKAQAPRCNREQRCQPPTGRRARKYSQDPDSQLADAGRQIEHHQHANFWAVADVEVPSSGSCPGSGPSSRSPIADVKGAQVSAKRGAKRGAKTQSVQAVSLPRTGECLIRRTTVAKAVSSSFFLHAPFNCKPNPAGGPPAT